VLPQGAFERMTDPTLDPVQRAKHFDARKSWYRLLGAGDHAQAMIKQWWRLGVIEPVDVPAGSAVEGPLHVEMPTSDDQAADDPTLTLIAALEHLAVPPDGSTQRMAEIALQPPSSRTFKRPRLHYRRGEV
jgi:hypothetical protein